MSKRPYKRTKITPEVIGILEEQNNESKLRKSLKKQLYLEARNKVLPQFSNDDDTIRAVRDNASYLRFNKSPDELTDEELVQLIKEFRQEPAEYPSKYQLDTLKFYAISCALIYADLNERFAINGEEYEGNALRNLLIKNFSERKLLPKPIIAYLYSSWINPKSNQFLMEGHYRKMSRKPQECYYEKLSRKEVQYLIKRFQLIHNNCINKIQPNMKISTN